MLKKEDFKKEVERIIAEFENKGFVMTEMRGEQWFRFLVKHSVEELSAAVDQLLLTQSFNPSFADLYKLLPEKFIEKAITRAPEEFVVNYKD